MAECPGCSGEGFVTSRTEPVVEAECLEDTCEIVIFEVDRDDR